jgi:hypothetical protein
LLVVLVPVLLGLAGGLVVVFVLQEVMVELYPGKQQLDKVGVSVFGRHFVDYGGPQQNLRQLCTQRDLLKAPPVLVVAQ